MHSAKIILPPDLLWPYKTTRCKD